MTIGDEGVQFLIEWSNELKFLRRSSNENIIVIEVSIQGFEC
jgi:hypothetical protein